MVNLHESPCPSVTIGIPVYNAERFIVTAVNSALAQDYRNLTILIYDNCSTDRSYAQCAELARANSNIILKQQPYNVGSVLNFQSIIDECDTEFLCFLGADDFISSNWISEQIRLEDTSSFIGLGQILLVSSSEDHQFDPTPLNSVNYNSELPFIRRLQFLFSPKKIPRMVLLWGLFPTSKACSFDKLFAGKANGSFTDVLWSYEMIKGIKARTLGRGIYYKRVHSNSESSKLTLEEKSTFSRILSKVSNSFLPSHLTELLARSNKFEIAFSIALFPFFIALRLLVDKNSN